MTKDKLISLAKGAGVAAVGAVLTYVTQWASGTDLGAFGPIVGGVLSTAANAVRLYVRAS